MRSNRRLTTREIINELNFSFHAVQSNLTEICTCIESSRSCCHASRNNTDFKCCKSCLIGLKMIQILYVYSKLKISSKWKQLDSIKDTQGMRRRFLTPSRKNAFKSRNTVKNVFNDLEGDSLFWRRFIVISWTCHHFEITNQLLTLSNHTSYTNRLIFFTVCLILEIYLYVVLFWCCDECVRSQRIPSTKISKSQLKFSNYFQQTSLECHQQEVPYKYTHALVYLRPFTVPSCSFKDDHFGGQFPRIRRKQTTLEVHARIQNSHCAQRFVGAINRIYKYPVGSIPPR